MMKKQMFTLTAVGLLLVGCSKQIPLTSPGEQKPMNPALAQLDLDGDLILFLNTSTIEQRILDYIDNMSSMILSASASTPSKPEIETFTNSVNKVKNAIEWSGLFSLDSYAMSVAPADGAFSRVISIASYSEKDADKALWRIMASEPKKLEGIGYVPSDAVYTINGTASLSESWKVVSEAEATLFTPEQATAFNQQAAMLEMMLGASIMELTESLDNEILISLQLSEKKQCMVPLGSGSTSFPEPSLLVGLQTKSPLVGELILTKLQEAGLPIAKTQHGSYTLNTLQLPIPAPFPVAPTLVQTDDYLLIGSSSAVIATALDSKSNGTGLVATPLYNTLLADVPEKTSGIEFLSPRFMQTYMTIMQQSLVSDMDPAGAAMLNAMFNSYTNMYSGGYSLKTPTSLYSRSSVNYGGAKPLEMAASAYIGMITAIAVPSFEKARSNSMEKACMNNRRIIDAAKEQWALENNKTQGDPVDAGIGEYIKGGLSALKCPAGGSYAIHEVGIPASCTYHSPAISHTLSNNRSRAMAVEAQAGCSTISVALRLHWVEHGTYDGINDPLDLAALHTGDLNGMYFNEKCYTLTSLVDGQNYSITAQGVGKAEGVRVTMTVKDGGTPNWDISTR